MSTFKYEPNNIPSWKFELGRFSAEKEKILKDIKPSIHVGDEVSITYQSVNWIQGTRKISLNNIKGICTKITASRIWISLLSDSIETKLSLPLVSSVIKSINGKNGPYITN